MGNVVISLVVTLSTVIALFLLYGYISKRRKKKRRRRRKHIDSIGENGNYHKTLGLYVFILLLNLFFAYSISSFTN